MIGVIIVILDFDKNLNIVIFDGDHTWHDVFGNDVTSDKTAFYDHVAQVTGLTISAVGDATANVALPFASTLQDVQVSVVDPSATDAVFEVFVTADSHSQLTVNLKTTTASATAGSTAKVNVRARGK